MTYKFFRLVSHWTAVTLAAFATTACAGGPSTTVTPTERPPIVDYSPPSALHFDGNGRCPAAQLQNLIGKPQSAFDALRLTGPVRLERPGQIVSMDFSLERTRVSLNAKGIITAIQCG